MNGKKFFIPKTTTCKAELIFHIGYSTDEYLPNELEVGDIIGVQDPEGYHVVIARITCINPLTVIDMMNNEFEVEDTELIGRLARVGIFGWSTNSKEFFDPKLEEDQETPIWLMQENEEEEVNQESPIITWLSQ